MGGYLPSWGILPFWWRRALLGGYPLFLGRSFFPSGGASCLPGGILAFWWGILGFPCLSEGGIQPCWEVSCLSGWYPACLVGLLPFWWISCLSGKAWVDHLSWVCQQLGLQPGSVETTVFSGYVGASWVWLVVYVDDDLIFSEDDKTAEAVFAHFEKYLTIKRTGMIQGSSKGGGRLRFLGRNLVRNPGESMISCYVDEAYLDSSFELYGLVKGTSSPPDLRPILDSEDRCNPLSTEAASKYKASLGKLSWLCQTLLFLNIYVCLLATGMSSPLDKHEHALRALLRWLNTQRGQRQAYPSQSDICERSDDTMLAYSDASWAPLKLLQRRSISGGVFFFRNSTIKAFSRLQQLVALSSCEAELSALAETGVESVGIKRLIGHIIGLSDNEIRIEEFTDSQAAWRVLKGSGLQRKSRHVELRVFWVQQRVQQEQIVLLWKEGSEMIADICTKTLGRKLFELFRFQMGFCERDDAIPLVVDEKKSKKVLKKQEIQNETSSQQAAAEACLEQVISMWVFVLSSLNCVVDLKVN